MFGGSVCASADLLPPAGDGWRSLAAVRDGNARPLGNPLARRGLGYTLRLFSLPLAWQSGAPQSSVGAVINRPPVQAATIARVARSGCAAVGGSAAYGCGVPLAGKAERAEGGTSGTLVTEILGAPQRETVKETLVKCVLAPRYPPHHPARDGNIDLAEEHSVPEGNPKSALAPIRRPPSRAEGHCTGARLAPFSFGPCTARFLFGQGRKENGGCIPLDNAPWREPVSPGG